jgi:predicted RNA-binding protein with PUA-like domain
MRRAVRVYPFLAMPKNYWVVKSEPGTYSIDDLARDGETGWEGVRNFQARNFMRDGMKPGDEVLFHHSGGGGGGEPGAAGVARVAGPPRPDPTQFDPKSDYHDPKSKRESPTWMMVHLAFVEKFTRLVSLADLKQDPRLAKMPLLQRGQRLSVMPTSAEEFRVVRAMGRAGR